MLVQQTQPQDTTVRLQRKKEKEILFTDGNQLKSWNLSLSEGMLSVCNRNSSIFIAPKALRPKRLTIYASPVRKGGTGDIGLQTVTFVTSSNHTKSTTI